MDCWGCTKRREGTGRGAESVSERRKVEIGGGMRGRYG